ncbi:MAG: MFS transporter [Planctomycetaceae bacterium]
MNPEEAATSLPRLSGDRAFWGMISTQFLGAFNDNLFKQLVLLLCVDSVAQGGRDFQPVALALFAVPFVMFSGLGGYLSDRTGKRLVVVLCKVGEIAVMTLGLVAFFVGGSDLSLLLGLLFIVLFFMSTQSAFFGPAKYGILPELFREDDLPAVNGVVQMTTFLAIIFGMALAGFTKTWFADQLWVISLFCIGIAILGTLTSLLVRKTAIAHPGLEFRASSLLITRETRRMLWNDRPLLKVLLVSSLFWFVGGVVQPTVNAFGKLQMNYGDGRTSIMAACLGVGIAIGCATAAKASHKRVNFGLVKIGSWGIVASLIATGLLGDFFSPLAKTPEKESLWQMLIPISSGEWAGRIALTSLGIFAGLFVVPLQVFMQTRPPRDQKGRMIGAMNLMNWIGIVFSAGFYLAADAACEAFEIAYSGIFLSLAVVMAPVAVLYSPRH